jgi:tRNA A-37 threonylcarbamoyl transferase component Bud32
MPAGPVLVRVAPGEPPGAAWRDALAESQGSGVVLKQEGEAVVRRATLRVAGAAREVVVKTRIGRGVAEAVKIAAGQGRLARQWRGAIVLGRLGVRTARPLALVRELGAASASETLIMEALEGRSLLEHLAYRDLDPATERAVAEAVGAQLGRFAAGMRFNRDHKPSNLIVRIPRGGEPEIAVIDCVAVRFAPVGLGGVERMLASLVLEPIGCGCPPTVWEMRRVVRAAARAMMTRRDGTGPVPGAVSALAWALWRAAAEIVEAHGDPTPRVNPLTAPSVCPDAGPNGWPGDGGLLGSRR